MRPIQGQKKKEEIPRKEKCIYTCVRLLLELFAPVAMVEEGEEKEEEGTKARVDWARRRRPHVVCKSLILGWWKACRM
jgi:hypothetical protein